MISLNTSTNVAKRPQTTVCGGLNHRLTQLKLLSIIIYNYDEGILHCLGGEHPKHPLGYGLEKIPGEYSWLDHCILFPILFHIKNMMKC